MRGDSDMDRSSLEVGDFLRCTQKGIPLAFLQGVCGGQYFICDLTARKSLIVDGYSCTRLEKGQVKGGLIGIMATSPHGGRGEIVDEHCQDGMLYVSMLYENGSHSPPLPLTGVTLCCPSC